MGKKWEPVGPDWEPRSYATKSSPINVYMYDVLLLTEHHFVAQFPVFASAENSECKKLVKHTIKTFGNIDILICNVGDGNSPKPGNEKINDWKKMLDINLNSAINLISASYTSLKKTSGSVVCISSIAGIETTDAPIPYSIAKSALNSYVKNISKPFAKAGIRINAVAPGNILFKGSIWEKKLAKNKNKVLDMISTKVAMNRFGTPDEIANAVSFLVSPLSSFTTGNILVIDGGQIKN